MLFNILGQYRDTSSFQQEHTFQDYVIKTLKECCLFHLKWLKSYTGD